MGRIVGLGKPCLQGVGRAAAAPGDERTYSGKSSLQNLFVRTSSAAPEHTTSGEAVQ